VTALLARSDGGYAVEVAGAGPGATNRLVPVSLGLFDDADGLVAVTGSGLAAGQAVVVVYCGTSANCAGGLFSRYQSEVDVGVYYGFNDLNLFGGLITIGGLSRGTTSW